MQIRWREDALIFVGASVLYLALGAYITLTRQYLPYDSLARLVSAWLVVEGTEAKLASIGFVWPPIPTLVILPFILFTGLVDSWMAVVIVSALFMAAACVALNHLAAACGLTRGWRWLAIVLFGLNPLMVIFAINGMSEAISIAITLAGCYWLVRFWQSDRNAHLILTAGFFGLLPLIRYELAVITAVAGLVLLILCWRRRSSFSEAEFRDFLEGRLLAYSSLAIFPLFLWSVSSWFVMGNPLYFLFNDRSAVSLAEAQISGYAQLVTNPFESFRLIFGVWSSAYLLGIIASLVAIFIGFYRRVYFLVGIAMLALVLPVMQTFLLSQRAYVPLLRYFVMVVPLGLTAALAVFSYLLPQISSDRLGRNMAMGAFAALMLISNLATWLLVERYPYQNIELETWKALTTNEDIENRNFEEAYAIGEQLLEIIPPGSRILIDTYEFGYAIMLGAGNHDLFLDFTDPNYEAAVAQPQGYADYVITPRPQERGALYTVNRAHKRLHAEGATWAEEMDVLPMTNLNWKLFKVK